MNSDVAPAAAGSARRAHVCEHCGKHYQAHRSTSRFCSTLCRVRNSRKAPTARKDLLREWLLRRSYAGTVGNGRLGLTVPSVTALEDWNLWMPEAAMTAGPFRARLRELSILSYRA